MMLVTEFGRLLLYNATTGQPVGVRQAFNGNQTGQNTKYGAPDDEPEDRIGTGLEKLRHTFLVAETIQKDNACSRCKMYIRC